MTPLLHLKKLAAAVLVILAAQNIGTYARQLTVNEALSIAKKENATPLLRNSRDSNRQFKLVRTEKADGLNTLYLLSSDNGGYLILSADDVAAPVLGYSEYGYFNPENIPANMQSWLDAYSNEIKAAANAGAAEYAYNTKTDYPAIEPLLKTKWDQGSPYNNLCPEVNGTHCPTGCTATAVAQVIKHHRWPAVGTGEYSYKWNNTTLSFNYGNTHFEWDKMLDSYNGTESAEEKNAIATLMYAVGVGSDMGYTQNSSGAYARNAARALIENFNYDKALNYLSRDFYSIDEWTDMVYNELAQGRPLSYDGANSNAGHAFVVDGYSTDGFFHLNWGWGGMSNGYFRLTALDPSNQGIGGSSAGYNQGQGALFGVKKPVVGSEYSYEFYFTGNFKPQYTTYTRSDNDNQIINFISEDNEMFYIASIFPIVMQPGVKLVSESGETSYIWWAYNTSDPLKPGYGYSILDIYASNFPKSGTYTVTPAVKCGDTIKDMKVAVGKIDKLKLVATESTLTFTYDDEKSELNVTEFNLKNTLYTGKTCLLSATISNSGAEYYGTVKPVIASASGTVLMKMSEIVIDLMDGKSVEVEWSETLSTSLPIGNYKLYLTDQNDKQISNTLDITINTPPSAPVSVEITDCSFPYSSGTTGQYPATMTSRDITINATFKCKQGLCDAHIYAFVFGQNEEYNVDIAGSRQVLLDPGKSQTYTFNATLENVTANTFYFIQFQGFANGSGEYIDIKTTSGSYNQYWIYITPEAGVEIIETEKNCTVTPNPAETTATVKSDSPIKEITIYSMSGSQAGNIQFDGTSNSEQIEVSSLTAGNYILKVNTAAGIKAVRMIKR